MNNTEAREALRELAEAIVGSFDEAGEFNFRTAEHGTADIRRMAAKALALIDARGTEVAS